MRYLGAGLVSAIALMSSGAAIAQTLTASFTNGAIAEYSNNPNGTDNGVLFSTLGITSMSISQNSGNGSWGGSQGNDTAVTAKITFTNGSSINFPAAINWVKNAGGGNFDWIGITIGSINVADGYNLSQGMSKTYVLAFPQSSVNLGALLPNGLDGSANTGQALNALNQYFPTAVASPPVITGPSGGVGAANSALSVNENQTAVTTVTASKPVTWSITGGTDQVRFAISSTGVIRFVAAPDFEAPTDSDTNNSYVLNVTATDSNGATAVQTITVTVLNLDDTAPVVTTGQSFSYPENQTANSLVGTVAATDAVGVTGFRFAANNSQTSADGYYTIDNGGAIRITAAGVAAGVANNDFEISPNAFRYTLQARDAAGNWSAAQSIALNVTDVADGAPPANPPVITGPGGSTGATSAISVPEGGTSVTTLTANVPISSWTIVGGNDQGRFVISPTGVLTFVAAPDFEAPTDSDTNNIYVLTVQATDANGNSSSQTVTVTVTDVADTPPVISGPGGSTGATSAISVPEGGTSVTTLTYNVPISSWTIAGGNDQGRFVISPTGVLTFVAAPDFEAPTDSDTNNIYVLTVRATDANGNVSTQTVTVTVTDLADTPPVISGPGNATGATSAISVPEGGTSVTTLTANVPISSWTIAGGNDQGRFVISPTGVLTFVAAPDFETPTDSDTNNIYVLTVRATDANGNVSTQTVTVTVTDLADTPPVISGPGGSTGATSAISVPEGGTSVTTLTSNVPISSWTIAGGNDQGRFVISPTGVLTFVAAPDFEAPTDSDTNNIYVLTVRATDANGNVSTQTVTVAVTDLADTAPVIRGPGNATGATSAISVPEGGTSVTTLTANVPISNWTIVGGNDQGRFVISPSGVLTFVAAPDFEAPTDSDTNNIYVLTVEATDANGNKTTQTVTVTVTNINELQQRIDEVSGELRGDLRNQVFTSLATMLSFNEALLRDGDADCSGDRKRKLISGRLNGDEDRQDGGIGIKRDLGGCQSRTRIFIDAGLAITRVDRNWSSRGMGSIRVEQKLSDRVTLGAGLLATTSQNDLGSFDRSRIADHSLQLNVYGRARLTRGLRLAGFAGWGRASYDFRLDDDGLDLEGTMRGSRHLYGAALSGDLRIGSLSLTTDAIMSRAVENIGSARFDAALGQESGSGLKLGLGRIDINRLSVPVSLPIVRPRGDGLDPTRFDLSGGLLCQDTAQDSSSIDCGYQFGFRTRYALSDRALFRAEGRHEQVDGYSLNLFAIGLERRFAANRGTVALRMERRDGAQHVDDRVLVRLAVGQ